MRALLETMTRDEKVQLAVGLSGVVVIGVITVFVFTRSAQASIPSKNYGIKINATCSDWEVYNQARFEATFEQTLDMEIANGNLDAHDIAVKFLRKISSGRCKGYGSQTTSPREAMLYYVIFRDVLQDLRHQNLIKESSFNARLLEAQAWGIEQGIEPDDFQSLEELISES